MPKPQLLRITDNRIPELTRSQILSGAFYALLDSKVEGTGNIAITSLLDKTYRSDQITGTGSAISFNVPGSKQNDLLYNSSTKFLYICESPNTWKYLMKLEDPVIPSAPLPSGLCYKSWSLSWDSNYDSANDQYSPMLDSRELFRQNGAAINQIDSKSTDSDFSLQISMTPTPYSMELIFPVTYTHVMWNYTLSIKWLNGMWDQEYYPYIYFGDSSSTLLNTNGSYEISRAATMVGCGEFDQNSEYARVLPIYFKLGSDNPDVSPLHGMTLMFDLVVNWKVLS